MTRPKWKRRLAWFAGGLAGAALGLFGIFGGGEALKAFVHFAGFHLGTDRGQSHGPHHKLEKQKGQQRGEQGLAQAFGIVGQHFGNVGDLGRPGIGKGRRAYL